ncbi:hypothetical protein F4604DRAFT_1905834, partial [Suillus subluteus]
SAHDCNAKTYKKFQVSVTPPIPKQLSNNIGSGRYGGDFWNNATKHDTNSTLSGSSALLGPLYFACTICLVALRHSTRKSSPTNTAPVPTLEFQLEKLRTFCRCFSFSN